MVVFLFPFHIFAPLANMWFIRLQEHFSILRTKVALTSIPSSALREGRWHLVEGETLSRNSLVLLLR